MSEASKKFPYRELGALTDETTPQIQADYERRPPKQQQAMRFFLAEMGKGSAGILFDDTFEREITARAEAALQMVGKSLPNRADDYAAYTDSMEDFLSDLFVRYVKGQSDEHDIHGRLLRYFTRRMIDTGRVVFDDAQAVRAMAKEASADDIPIEYLKEARVQALKARDFTDSQQATMERRDIPMDSNRVQRTAMIDSALNEVAGGQLQQALALVQRAFPREHEGFAAEATARASALYERTSSPEAQARKAEHMVKRRKRNR